MYSCHLVKEDLNICSPPQCGSQRLRDIARRQSAECHLIQERLESVMISPIDKDNVYWLTRESFRGAQSSESTANNNHLFSQSILQDILSRHLPGSNSYCLWRAEYDGTRLCRCACIEVSLFISI
jgi:hypothetical protein